MIEQPNNQPINYPHSPTPPTVSPTPPQTTPPQTPSTSTPPQSEPTLQDVNQMTQHASQALTIEPELSFEPLTSEDALREVLHLIETHQADPEAVENMYQSLNLLLEENLDTSDISGLLQQLQSLSSSEQIQTLRSLGRSLTLNTSPESHLTSQALDQVMTQSSQETEAIQQATSDIQAQLQTLAQDGQPSTLERILEQRFGDKMAPQQLQLLLTQARAGQFPMPPIEVVAGSVLQDNHAAYTTASTPKILINEDILAEPEVLLKAILEEQGHHIDHLLGGADSRGDEGELFERAISKGDTLTAEEIGTTDIEDDHGIIEINGEAVEVEFQESIRRRMNQMFQGGISDEEKRTIGEWLVNGSLTGNDLIDVISYQFFSNEDKLAFVEAVGEQLPYSGNRRVEQALVTQLLSPHTSDEMKHALLQAIPHSRVSSRPYADELKTYLLAQIGEAPPADVDKMAKLLLEFNDREDARPVADALIARAGDISPEIQARVIDFVRYDYKFGEDGGDANLARLRPNLGENLAPETAIAWLNATPLYAEPEALFRAEIFRHLDSENTEVRAAAIEALQGKKLTFTMAEFESIATSDSPEILRAVLNHIKEGTFSDPEVVQRAQPLFENLMEHDDKYVRQAVLRAVSDHQDDMPEVAQEILINALDDPHPSNRYTALGGFYTSGDTQVIDALVNFLRQPQTADNRKQALSVAAYRVRNLRDEMTEEQRSELSQVLQQELTTNPDARSRAHAADLLYSLGIEASYEQAASDLLLSLDSSNEIVKERAIELLGKVGDSSAVQPLMSILASVEVVEGEFNGELYDLRNSLKSLLEDDPAAIAEAMNFIQNNEANNELVSSVIEEIITKQKRTDNQSISMANLQQFANYLSTDPAAAQSQFNQFTPAELDIATQAFSSQIEASSLEDIQAITRLLRFEPSQVSHQTFAALRTDLATYNRNEMYERLTPNPELLNQLETQFLLEASRLSDSEAQSELINMLPGIDMTELALYRSRGSLAQIGQLMERGPLSSLPPQARTQLITNVNRFMEMSGIPSSEHLSQLNETELSSAVAKIEAKLGLPESGQLSLENFRQIERTQRNLLVMTTNAQNILKDELMPLSRQDLRQLLEDESFSTQVNEYIQARQLPDNENSRLGVANLLRLNQAMGLENNQLNAESALSSIQAMREKYHWLIDDSISDDVFSMELYADTMSARNQWLQESRTASARSDILDRDELQALVRIAGREPGSQRITYQELQAIANDDETYTIQEREVARKLVENERLYDYIWSYNVGDELYRTETDTTLGQDGRLDISVTQSQSERENSGISLNNLRDFGRFLAQESITHSDNSTDNGIVLSQFYDGREAAAKIFSAANVEGDEWFSWFEAGIGTNEGKIIGTIKDQAEARGKLIALRRDYERLYGNPLLYELKDEMSGGDLGEATYYHDSPGLDQVAAREIGSAERAEVLLRELLPQINHIGDGNGPIAWMAGHSGEDDRRRDSLMDLKAQAETAISQWRTKRDSIEVPRRISDQEIRQIPRLEETLVSLQVIHSSSDGPQRAQLTQRISRLQEHIANLNDLKELRELDEQATELTARIMMELGADAGADTGYSQTKTEAIAVTRNIAVVVVATVVTVATAGTAAPLMAVAYGTAAGTGMALASSAAEETGNYLGEANRLNNQQDLAREQAASLNQLNAANEDFQQETLTRVRENLTNAQNQAENLSFNTDKVINDTWEGFKTSLITSGTTMLTMGLGNALPGGQVAASEMTLLQRAGELGRQALINGVAGATSDLAQNLIDPIDIDLDRWDSEALEQVVTRLEQHIEANRELRSGLVTQRSELQEKLEKMYENYPGLRDSQSADAHQVSSQDPVTYTQTQRNLGPIPQDEFEQFIQMRLMVEELDTHIEELDTSTLRVEADKRDLEEMRSSAFRTLLPFDWNEKKWELKHHLGRSMAISFLAGSLLNSVDTALGLDSAISRAIFNSTTGAAEMVSRNAIEKYVDGKADKDLFEGVVQAALTSTLAGEASHRVQQHQIRQRGLEQTVQGRAYAHLDPQTRSRLESQYHFDPADPRTHARAFEDMLRNEPPDIATPALDLLKQERAKILQDISNSIRERTEANHPDGNADLAIAQYWDTRFQLEALNQRRQNLDGQPDSDSRTQALAEIEASESRLNLLAEDLLNGRVNPEELSQRVQEGEETPQRPETDTVAETPSPSPTRRTPIEEGTSLASRPSGPDADMTPINAQAVTEARSKLAQGQALTTAEIDILLQDVALTSRQAHVSSQVQKSKVSGSEAEALSSAGTRGACGFCQHTAYFHLVEMGIPPSDIRLHQAAEVVGDNRHSFLTVRMPDNNFYIVDPTFRQFVDIPDGASGQSSADRVLSALDESNGNSRGVAMADELLQRGFIRLDDNVANLYGKALRLRLDEPDVNFSAEDFTNPSTEALDYSRFEMADSLPLLPALNPGDSSFSVHHLPEGASPQDTPIYQAAIEGRRAAHPEYHYRQSGETAPQPRNSAEVVSQSLRAQGFDAEAIQAHQVQSVDGIQGPHEFVTVQKDGKTFLIDPNFSQLLNGHEARRSMMRETPGYMDYAQQLNQNGAIELTDGAAQFYRDMLQNRQSDVPLSADNFHQMGMDADFLDLGFDLPPAQDEGTQTPTDPDFDPEATQRIEIPDFDAAETQRIEIPDLDLDSAETGRFRRPDLDSSDTQRIEIPDFDAAETQRIEIPDLDLDSAETGRFQRPDLDSSDTHRLEIPDLDSAETQRIEVPDFHSAETGRFQVPDLAAVASSAEPPPSLEAFQRVLPFGDADGTTTEVRLANSGPQDAWLVKNYNPESGMATLERTHIQMPLKNDSNGLDGFPGVDITTANNGDVITDSYGVQWTIDNTSPGKRRMTLSRLETQDLPASRLFEEVAHGRAEIKGPPRYDQPVDLMEAIRFHLQSEAVRQSTNQIERVGDNLEVTAKNGGAPQDAMLPQAYSSYQLQLPDGTPLNQDFRSLQVDAEIEINGTTYKVTGKRVRKPMHVTLQDVTNPANTIQADLNRAIDTRVHAYDVQVDLPDGQNRSFELLIPANDDGSPNLELKAQMEAAIRELPFDHLRHLEQLRVNPTINVDDVYWHDIGHFTGDQGSAATAGGTHMDFYPMGVTNTTQDSINGIAQHELGHLIANGLYGSTVPSQRWMEAIRNEPHHVSDYAQSNLAEDFADTVMVYLQSDGGRLPVDGVDVSQFQNRFRVLNEIFRTNPQARALLEIKAQQFMESSTTFNEGNLITSGPGRPVYIFLPMGVKTTDDED